MDNNTNRVIADEQALNFHLKQVQGNERRFETAAQAVSRMILDCGVEKTSRGGRTVYEFPFFRQGNRHIVGWYDEISAFVNFVHDAARGGPSDEQAFVLIGEPGNGKTYFVEYISSKYRQFTAQPENRRFTFEFVNLEQLGKYGNIYVAQSQTLEDPVILAMNLFPTQDESKEHLGSLGFDDKEIEGLYRTYRPLGACTEHIWSDIREKCDGDMEQMLQFVRVVSVPMTESTGVLTGKYSARDKITSSATDLLGGPDLVRTLNIADTNPYRYNIRLGALARVGGGGIHFSDEMFKNKPDLVQIYLQLIQSNTIELDGFKWPIDTLIVATSNNHEFNRFISEGEQAPTKDRAKACYVAHNTDYRLQEELTGYVIGNSPRSTVMGEEMHEDPNLKYVLSTSVALTRLPHNQKLTPIETMKLEAGEVAGDKSMPMLREVREEVDKSQDVTKRWGQKGVGHRGLGRVVLLMLEMSETHEGKCLFARDAFAAMEREIIDHINEAVDREKFLSDIAHGRTLYRQRVRTSIYNAYREDPDAVRKDVIAYVNMVIGFDPDKLGPERMWRYRDPQSGELKSLKIDENFIESVERHLGLNSNETRKAHRSTISRIYSQRVSTDPNYDFMDNEELVKAVTDVRIDSDVAGASSLIGALANRVNDENKNLYNRMIEVMFSDLGYCRTCAEKTIEYICEKDDES